MGMKVLGHLTHLPIDGPVSDSETSVGRDGERIETVFDHRSWRLGPVTVPHHHRHAARLTVGNPADVVLGVPVGETIGRAQLAALDSGPV